MLVILLVGSFFAVHVAETVAIILAYGPHAFFVQGLRLTNWKHDALSNGAHLSLAGKLIELPATLILIGVLVFASDFAAMQVRALVMRSARWIGVFLHLVGSAGLLLFWLFMHRRGYSLMHPVALSAFAGGAALLWKTISINRRNLRRL